MTPALSFDDVLLVPNRSSIHSRKDITLQSPLNKWIHLEHPIVSANMPSVTDPIMAYEMSRLGGLGILPRFNTIDEAVSDFRFVYGRGAKCGVSLGVGDDTEERFISLYDNGARIFCIDVAHGHHDRVIETIKMVENWRGDSHIIAGNVATYEAAYDLAEAGAQTIKVGIGPGAACTTREVTGFGVPQLSAIQEVALVKNDFNVYIMADGGIKNSGDIVKALVFGADTVMVGRLLAGVREAPYPGEYFGNASLKLRQYRAPEGVSGEVEDSGTLEDIIKSLTWGIKSGLSYAGVSSIFDLHNEDVDYVLVTQQGMNETRTRI